MKLPFALARRFVAGESFQEALPKVEELNQLNLKITLDLLGENVADRGQAEQTRHDYIQLLEQLHASRLQCSISIKLTMMGLDIDPEFCRENLFALLEVAKKNGQFVRIDMEGSAYTKQTIALFKQALQHFNGHVGIVIQAYLKRTEADINELSQLGADIRLCKGAYSETEDLALQSMSDIRTAYLKYVQVLLEHTPYPRFGTHDDHLIDFIKHYVCEHNIDKSRFEFQMLYGLRLQTCVELAKQGFNVRIYVPFGTEWFPYFSRRLRERKENIWFVISTLFRK